jgi:hypothetical protein
MQEENQMRSPKRSQVQKSPLSLNEELIIEVLSFLDRASVFNVMTCCRDMERICQNFRITAWRTLTVRFGKLDFERLQLLSKRRYFRLEFLSIEFNWLFGSKPLPPPVCCSKLTTILIRCVSYRLDILKFDWVFAVLETLLAVPNVKCVHLFCKFHCWNMFRTVEHVFLHSSDRFRISLDNLLDVKKQCQRLKSLIVSFRNQHHSFSLNSSTLRTLCDSAFSVNIHLIDFVTEDTPSLLFPDNHSIRELWIFPVNRNFDFILQVLPSIEGSEIESFGPSPRHVEEMITLINSMPKLRRMLLRDRDIDIDDLAEFVKNQDKFVDFSKRILPFEIIGGPVQSTFYSSGSIRFSSESVSRFKNPTLSICYWNQASEPQRDSHAERRQIASRIFQEIP